MNTRQTSIDCYHQIKAEGLLSERRFEAYEAIFENAPCTSAEAMSSRLNSSNVLSQSRSRFTELRNLGVIYEKDERPCKITGRTAIEWDLTDELPSKLKKTTNTKKKRIENAIKSLGYLYNLCKKNTATDGDWVIVADLIKKI